MHDKGYYHSYCGGERRKEPFGHTSYLSRNRGGVCRNAMGCSLAVGEGSVDEYARVAVARDVGSGSKPDH